MTTGINPAAVAELKDIIVAWSERHGASRYVILALLWSAAELHAIEYDLTPRESLGIIGQALQDMQDTRPGETI